LGHSVSGFNDPKIALETFRLRPQDFDVIVTDLSMPKMSGIDLAREVLALRPEMPVLLVSGNISDAEASLVNKVGVRTVLQKPISANELGFVFDGIFHGDDPGEKRIR
jgi:CheY-like chemotaxis protein